MYLDTPTIDCIRLAITEEAHLDQVLPLIRSFHAEEGIIQSNRMIVSAVQSLLGDSDLGRLWRICLSTQTIGYICLCFGYSIEFRGRDAFIDEMYISPEHRGQGYGKAALDLVHTEAAAAGVRALHLEVSKENSHAQRLYRTAGFVSREHYFLMSKNI